MSTIRKVMSYLRRYLRPALKHFKNIWPILIGLILIFLFICIWWLGPEWTFNGKKPLESLTARIAASIVVLVVPLFYWTISTRRQYKKMRDEKRYEDAVDADPSIPYVQAFERQLDESLLSLKENNTGGDYLYKQPWYLVLGQEGSGKTSLANRSNQTFSLTNVLKAGRVRTAKDPYLLHTVDWWVGNEAVLIDPPGEIISQQHILDVNGVEKTSAEGGSNGADDAQGAASTEQTVGGAFVPADLNGKLWNTLINWLDKNRSRRPLNGLIITIDLTTLLNQSPSERKTLAILLRARLFELTKKLGTRLPLYLVLTKFDLIDGFDAFFSKLPHEVREEIFGFTFTLDSIDDYDLWLDEFTRDYDGLVSRINEQVFDAIGEPNTQQERESLYSFVAQLAGIRNMLVVFLTEMLGSDRYSTPALVRGIYFSSVYQQGLLTNALIDEAAKTYALSRPIPTAKEESRGKVFFAQKLFQDIIYPEAGLAADNIKVVAEKRRVFVVNSLFATLVCFATIGSWHAYFNLNKDKSLIVLNKTQDYVNSHIDTTLDVTGKNLLEPLNQISSAVNVFGDYRDVWPMTKDMGLYEGRKIGPKVDEAYLHLLKGRFLPALGTGLINTMDASEKGSDEKLAALRVYRMLQDIKNRRPDIVETWMARMWQSAYPNDGGAQNNLMGHLKYAMLYAQADMPQFKSTVRDAQAELSLIPLQQRVYMSLKSSARDVLSSPFDFRSAIGPSFDVVFNVIPVSNLDGSLSTSSSRPDVLNAQAKLRGVTDKEPLFIDMLFTKRGFKSYFEPQSKEVAELAMIDEWVLGERDTINYSKLDEKIMKDQIVDYYIRDYIDTWLKALNRMEVTDFDSVQHSVLVLGTVVDNAAPLRRMLEVVSNNSNVYKQVQLAQDALRDGEKKEGDKNNPKGADAITLPVVASVPAQGTLEADALRITRSFSTLSNMLEAKDGNPTPYEDVMRGVSDLYNYTKSVHDSPNRGQAALELVSARFALKGADPISNLQRIASGLPSPMDRHITKLAKETERVLMLEALGELETLWDAEIYTFYRQRLAPHYPFNPASKSDVALADFEKFFAPDGMLNNFKNKYLTVFLGENLSASQIGTTQSYLVRTDVFNQLEKAEKIQDAFFNNRGALNIQFTVQPMGLQNNLRNSVLNVEGQLLPYRHGATDAIGLIWPNNLSADVMSKITLVNASGGSSEIAYRGPWGLYRLLSRGVPSGNTSATSIDLAFSFSGGSVKYRISTEKQNNPFTTTIFRGFSLPRTLLNG